MVMTAVRLMHVEIYYSCIKAPRHSFSAGNHQRRMVKEIDHMPLVAVARLLITHESGDGWGSLAAIPHKVEEYEFLFQRY